jgi:ParB-like chromosome segregation protein Spo0J
MSIQTISIDRIEVGAHLRSLREEGVVALVASIREIDLHEPITVVCRRHLDRDVGGIVDAFDLVAGNHRLEACHRLGRAEIRADVVEMNELEARLREIDENLCRAELTALERAEHRFYRTRNPGHPS